MAWAADITRLSPSVLRLCLDAEVCGFGIEARALHRGTTSSSRTSDISLTSWRRSACREAVPTNTVGNGVSKSRLNDKRICKEILSPATLSHNLLSSRYSISSCPTPLFRSARNLSPPSRHSTMESSARTSHPFSAPSPALHLSSTPSPPSSELTNKEQHPGSKRRMRGHVMAAKKKAQGEGTAESSDGQYRSSVNLPSTPFGMRANSLVKEPEIQKFWEDKKVFQSLQQSNPGESFTLHDGPPYANGDLHTGHALNKLLKDFVNRYQILQGRKVYYVPGWDCHGLPIELKVLQSMTPEARLALNPIKLRKKAAQFALKTMDNQRAGFKRWGVWGDWEHPYLTLQPEYEAAQLGVFGKMVLNGHIYRGKKPVHWSPSSRTALAEAELEYPEKHTSRSVYVAMQVTEVSEGTSDAVKALLPNLSLAIWTTTPWTMPGNAAIAVNDKLTYAVVEVCSLSSDPSDPSNPLVSEQVPETTEETSAEPKKRFGRGAKNYGKALLSQGHPAESNSGAKAGLHLVVALDLVGPLEAKLERKLVVKETLLGSTLVDWRYTHPIESRTSPVVMGGDYITTESGTGLVHTAPGHGQEDYQTGLKFGLPMISPVDDDGNFTAEAGEKFAGLSVLAEGNVAMIEELEETGALLLEEAYVHKYPYDWRTKQPTIFRATEQWFASVEGFRQEALEAIGNVQWVPPQGENRITSMTVGRADWCISRQRTWGVPIPVFYHRETGEALMTEESIAHIQELVRAKGSDAWFELSEEQLLPESYRSRAHEYKKGMDTMDVWFDSGSSWAGVVEQREGLRFPADLYLEGSDQHRGWFQSSLLTAVAATGRAPYKQVLTHGFALDESGRKMSKSVGNVVDPRLIILGGKNQKEEPGYGADVLRLWVSSVDYTGDVLIGQQIIRQMADVYRKLRGTLRFLLGNLYDWTPEAAVPYDQLPDVDKYVLSRLAGVMDEIKDSYDKYQFYRFFQSLQRFVVVELSNFYFDVCKDRLYVGALDSHTRRSCQTVLGAHLLCLLGSMAPVLPHMAEDAWQCLPFPVAAATNQARTAVSVFEALWPTVQPEWRSFPESNKLLWSRLLQIRTEANKVCEQARVGKLIGANLDAKAYLQCSDPELGRSLAALAGEAGKEGSIDHLRYVLLTSQVEVLESREQAEALGLEYSGTSSLDEAGELWVGVARAEGGKCERCWNFSTAVGNFTDHPSLCERCHPVIVQNETAKAANEKAGVASAETPVAV
eukprot:TRINITY_DN4844_c0_g1_i1.p1 TRINITY_DN4844_c0_g1~~TRINITY_DN4844_c0_g1_i1.p1  ORF type:complete len:1233 (-),score=240.75 TRINITY_DN4844_c0_g1_i1:598-4296(-)